MANSFSVIIKNPVKNWYLILIVGAIFVILGFWNMVKPLDSYLTFALIFSISFLTAGFLEIVFAVSNTKELDHWLWNLVYGIVNSLVGLLLITNREILILTLPVYIRFTLLFRSIMTIGISLDLPRSGVSDLNSWIGMGIIGLAFSLILFWNPNFAGLSLIVWRSIALVTVGVYSVCFSFKIKNRYITVENVFID